MRWLVCALLLPTGCVPSFPELPACLSDQDCSGAICIDGQCVAEGHDAGIRDAEVEDASPRDAFMMRDAEGDGGTESDGGLDGGPFDMGTEDAGVADDGGDMDAGQVDGGNVDGGTVDGGTVDGGSDGGSVDAGSDAGSDAGTPDAGSDGGTLDGASDGGTLDGGSDGGLADGGGPLSYQLTVTLPGGSGSLGRVRTAGLQIDCGTSCVASFSAGTVVTLNAEPRGLQRLQTWGGNCSGSQPTCNVTMSANRSVSATFMDTPPGNAPGRTLHASAYDGANNRVIVFGGLGMNGGLNDTWIVREPAFDNGNPQWIPATVLGTPPPGRFGHSAGYDPVSNRLIVFGGTMNTSTLTDEIWILESANGNGFMRWIPPSGPVVFPAPSARSGHVAVFVPPANRMFMFGGDVNDITPWMLSNANAVTGLATWSMVSAGALGPPGHDNSAADYDPTDGRMLMYGGDGNGLDPDAYLLAPLGNVGSPSWTTLLATNQPPARQGHAVAYDPTNDALFMFGGLGFDDGVFALRNTRGGPPPAWSLVIGPVLNRSRFYHTAHLSNSGRLIIVCGQHTPGGPALGNIEVLRDPNSPTPSWLP